MNFSSKRYFKQSLGLGVYVRFDLHLVHKIQVDTVMCQGKPWASIWSQEIRGYACHVRKTVKEIS